MPITPSIPVSGLAGWRFLQATQERQQAVFSKSPDIEIRVNKFKATAGAIQSLDELMSDRNALEVVLGAYGLGDEINKGAFIRRALEEGTSEPAAFAVRLNNSNYLAMAKAISVTNGAIDFNTELINTIVKQYTTLAFEAELGTVDNDLRLAANFKREIQDLASQDITENTFWYKVMASEPLSLVIESAFGLPSEFSSLDIDKRLSILSQKANAEWGSSSPEIFENAKIVESAIRKFLLNQQIVNGPSADTPGMASLAILGNINGQIEFETLLLSKAVSL